MFFSGDVDYIDIYFSDNKGNEDNKEDNIKNNIMGGAILSEDVKVFFH